MIENGKPIGVVLTMEEYELLRTSPYQGGEKEGVGGDKGEVDQSKPTVSNPIGEAMVEEINFPTASANIDEINLADTDDITLEDLGLDELPY